MLQNIKFKSYLPGLIVTIALLAVSVAALFPAASASADSHDGQFACVDSTTALKVAKNNKAHTVTISCKSGAKIDYLLNKQYKQVVNYTAKCSGSYVPGPSYPSGGKTVVLHCYNGTGNPNSSGQTVNVTPSFSQGSSGVSCWNNEVVAKKSDCPKQPAGGGNVSLGNVTSGYVCGGPGNQIRTSINFGCRHKGNAVMDMLFAIIRFLSAGVGIVIVASMVYAGIQYTTSRGDPQATAMAIGRIRSNVIALFIFIFAYAILNYVIPGQILK